MIRIIFSKFAKLEMEDAARLYELEYPGLGQRFKEGTFVLLHKVTHFQPSRVKHYMMIFPCIKSKMENQKV